MIDPVDHVISRSLLAGVAIGIGGCLYLLSYDSMIGSVLASTQMKTVSLAYKEYKENGGSLSWNEFQIYYNKVIK